ncbi:Uncharacterized protein conserved in bacteria [Leclercia adecarboxylata]|uniref:Uncharacterized protein conserved in bacteria n=1 Tax=Leclercia adecarboxylata TaxID=83655 RepID=A0A4U9I501_9ENTR|nr:Uncharacterized protein conserved in bacteria [Leclercia adecarboxylata]
MQPKIKKGKKSCCYGNMFALSFTNRFRFMPQLSRYSDEHVEQMLSELLNVLEKHKAPTDLSLMVLGKYGD